MESDSLYQKMYMVLFHAATNAIKALDCGKKETAREILIHAQQLAEELFLDAEEE